MAGPARDDLSTSKVGLVDGGHHLHHPAGRAFARRVECPIYLVGTGRGMTANAVRTNGCRHDAHRQHEIVDAEALHGLDVLEDGVHRRWCLRGRGARLRRFDRLLTDHDECCEQACAAHENHRPGSDRHVWYPSPCCPSLDSAVQGMSEIYRGFAAAPAGPGRESRESRRRFRSRS